MIIEDCMAASVKTILHIPILQFMILQLTIYICPKRLTINDFIIKEYP